MSATVIKATIQRRVLVNYRVDPDALSAILPEPFRPALVGGVGIAGLCLIRLGGIRPSGMPYGAGSTSENAAHRVAVEWDGADGPVSGVYIPRRDTSSRIAALLGGRVFPGWQHLARFRVQEADGSYRIEVASRDGEVEIAVAAHRAPAIMADSVFGNMEEASGFYRCAPLSYAATRQDGVFDGVELSTDGWDIAPLALDEVRSTFFDSLAGAAVPDSAFLMTGLETSWRALPAVRAPLERHPVGS